MSNATPGAIGAHGDKITWNAKARKARGAKRRPCRRCGRPHSNTRSAYCSTWCVERARAEQKVGPDEPLN